VLGISHGTTSSGALRRALPLLALVVALFGACLQPPRAAIGAWIDPAVDTVDGSAVQPKPSQLPSPPQLEAATKKFPGTQAGSAPDATSASADGVGRADCNTRLDGIAFEIFHPEPAAIVAQPRAPPFSRT
jgi:hypothetical protein